MIARISERECKEEGLELNDKGDECRCPLVNGKAQILMLKGLKCKDPTDAEVESCRCENGQQSKNTHLGKDSICRYVCESCDTGKPPNQ